MRVIKFEDKYRDDLIFMILEAKNALGRVPGLNEDLLDMMKLIILKDDGDFYFVTPDCYYSNQIINFIFSLNKIGITY